MISANEGEALRRDAAQEQLEAQYAALGCTVLPPDVNPLHKAFPALLAAVIKSDAPLTQQQMRDIIDANE